MIPLEFINRIGVVRDLIRSGDLQQATELLDRMTQELHLLIIAMDDTEKMEILGQFAHRYDEIGATEKQIPFLEPRLCTHLSLFCGCRLNSGPHRFGWSTS